MPSFGGSPATWAACLLFFQTILLVGYAYAHGSSRLPPRLHLALHGLVALAALGGIVLSRSLPVLRPGKLAPAFEVARVLSRQVGPAYLLLFSTAPLLQRWAAWRRMRAPHRLYAVSNAGSLLALISYPALIEASLSLSAQYRLWSIACGTFAFAHLAGAALTFRSAPNLVAVRAPPPSAADGLYWSACAFVPSLFLLAATNHITVDIAPTPLFWVLPLGLYLLSFILAFAGKVAAWRAWLTPLFVLATIGLGYNAFAEGSASLFRQLLFSLGALFLASLLCHDALVRARPSDEALTGFYLWVAFGGALGGLFVSLIAPLIWNDYYELELATVLSYALLTFSGRGERTTSRRFLWVGLGICLPLMAADVTLRSSREGRTGRVLERRRSFLGALRVSEFDVGRVLTHGRIRHGMQLIDPAQRDRPTMYFGPGTAVAQIMSEHAIERPRQIGVVGLGIGTLAAYGRSGDALQFYEIDPNVLGLARKWFSFLSDTPAQVEVAIGDGRLSLARQNRRFDILVLDAFASDAVPAHLLTHEAFELYRRRLTPDGVLLANVSNRHLAVERVVRASARAVGLGCVIVETQADASRFVSKVRWAVMMREPAALARSLHGLTLAADSGGEVLWTDARASLWSILR